MKGKVARKRWTKKAVDDFFRQLKEDQKDPEFIRAAHEFIKHHTS
jgi:hypothetical protein